MQKVHSLNNSIQNIDFPFKLLTLMMLMQSCLGETSCFLSPPGGGSGIGRSVCQRFASEGASVVVADISEESANETLGSLSSDLRGQGHMAAVVDVSSKESVKKLVASIQVCVCVWYR